MGGEERLAYRRVHSDILCRCWRWLVILLRQLSVSKPRAKKLGDLGAIQGKRCTEIADKRVGEHLGETHQWSFFSLSCGKKGTTSCLNDGNKKKLRCARRFGHCSAKREARKRVGEGVRNKKVTGEGEGEIVYLCRSLRSSPP